MTSREQGRDPDRDPLSFEDGMESGPTLVSPLDWAKLFAGSLRRRRVLAVTVFLSVIVAAAAYYRTTPPVYRVEARILAERPPALSGGAGSDSALTRSAWDLVHRRDNLIALAKQGGLLEGELADPAPSLRSRLLALLRPASEQRKEEPVDVLVRVLDRRLAVNTDEGSIEIRLDWPDPQQAYRIVQAAVQSFLEARYVQEVTFIDDVIAQMESRIAKLKADLEEATADAATRRRSPGPARAAGPRERSPSEDLARLRSLVEAKARATRDVEEFRSRRMAELESQLNQARATLSDLHPTVVSLRRDIEALSNDSPQLQALREEERRVRAEFAAQAAKEGSPALVGTEPLVIDAGGRNDEDPRVRDLRLQHEQMAARLMSAHVDLDAARAAFKYRYKVIWPPEIPVEPFSPKPARVFGLAFAAALLLALLTAVLPDLLSGRIVERWQIERQLGLTVLAETPPARRSRR